VTHKHLHPWMTCLFVSPQHRRKGVGHKLIEHLTAMAGSVLFSKPQEQPQHIYLWTETHRAMYEKMGWVFLEKADANFIMKLLLTAPDHNHSLPFDQKQIDV